MTKETIDHLNIIASGILVGYTTEKFLLIAGENFMNWLIDQISNFNLLTFLAIVIFNTALSRANTTKLLKEQSQEFYNDIEELKDEIRGNTNKKG